MPTWMGALRPRNGIPQSKTRSSLVPLSPTSAGQLRKPTGLRAGVLLATCLLALLCWSGVASAANPIEVENAKPGTTDWRLGQNGRRVANDAQGQIKGYGSVTSVDKGGQITFKVSVDHPQQYTVDIYRVGCYADASGTCLGGRFMTQLGPIDGTTGPA